MIHKGQVGAVIRLTSTFDLSTATARTIRYMKPSGRKGEWVATLNGSSNIQYTTTAENELDESGPWTFQGFATFSNGNTAVSTRVMQSIGNVIDT